MAEVKTVELLADLSAFANIGEGMFFFLLFSFFKIRNTLRESPAGGACAQNVNLHFKSQ